MPSTIKIKCDGCGKEVSTTLKACSHCGAALIPDIPEDVRIILQGRDSSKRASKSENQVRRPPKKDDKPGHEKQTQKPAEPTKPSGKSWLYVERSPRPPGVLFVDDSLTSNSATPAPMHGVELQYDDDFELPVPTGLCAECGDPFDESGMRQVYALAMRTAMDGSGWFVVRRMEGRAFRFHYCQTCYDKAVERTNALQERKARISTLVGVLLIIVGVLAFFWGIIAWALILGAVGLFVYARKLRQGFDVWDARAGKLDIAVKVDYGSSRSRPILIFKFKTPQYARAFCEANEGRASMVDK